MENLDLLYNIGDIILNTDTYDKALDKIVSHLNRFMESDVCSIYLFNGTKGQLVLSATDGLHKDAVGKVTMVPSDGLTGLAFSENRYVFIKDASKHSKFKYFPGIGEEPFTTFVGIPLKDKKSTFGVLVFQFRESKEPVPVMKKLLVTVASIVSGMLLRFHIMEMVEESEQIKRESDLLINGLPLSGGIAIGTPVHIIYNYFESSQEQFTPEKEIQKLDRAFEETRKELSSLISQMENTHEHTSTDIFHAHLMILQDGAFMRDMKNHIVKHKKGAAFSIRHVSDKFIQKFRAIPDPYLKERAADVEDVCQRMLANLGVLDKTTTLKENSIIITDRLTPGETASLDMEKVSGFITEKDGPTSHTAILARNRQIPAVSGIHYLLKMTEFAEKIIIDGYKGKVIINPSDKTLKEYTQMQEELVEAKAELEEEVVSDTLLKEYGISLYANVSSILDAEKAYSLNADGIGLVRTEIFYLQKQGDFNYDTQVEIYSQIANSFRKGPIVFRLLDLGADKKIRGHTAEDNPALGFRGLRLLLKERDLLISQINALLKVSNDHPVRLLVPFITDIREYLQARDIIIEQANLMNIHTPPIGAMIEIPSAVFILEELFPHADFFSIGTNDLFQYFCAVDRNNSSVSDQYSPDSRAFIRLLEMIYQKTRGCGKDVEICGEIAADPSILSKLLEIGYKQFSINPYSIQTTRKNLLHRFSSQ